MYLILEYDSETELIESCVGEKFIENGEPERGDVFVFKFVVEGSSVYPSYVNYFSETCSSKPLCPKQNNALFKNVISIVFF